MIRPSPQASPSTVGEAHYVNGPGVPACRDSQVLPSVFEHCLQAVHHGGYGRHTILPPTQGRGEEEGLQTLHDHSQEPEKQALQEGGLVKGWGRSGHRVTIMLNIPLASSPTPTPSHLQLEGVLDLFDCHPPLWRAPVSQQ